MMSNSQEQKTDWIHLPKDVEELSLWSCLHDGELLSSTSNLLERFITLEVLVNHLIEDKENPIRFLLNIDEVSSVRAIGHFRYVGKFEEPENISDFERRILTGKHLIWREESLSWSDFESALATDPLQISDAGYVEHNDQTTLRLGGFLDGEKFDDIYFYVFLRGKSLTASRSDGEDFSLDKFIELGRNYWDSFANNAK